MGGGASKLRKARPKVEAAAKLVLMLKRARSVRAYFDVDELLESVASGAIAPLRGRWLVQLHRSGGRLQ